MISGSPQSRNPLEAFSKHTRFECATDCLRFIHINSFLINHHTPVVLRTGMGEMFWRKAIIYCPNTLLIHQHFSNCSPLFVCFRTKYPCNAIIRFFCGYSLCGLTRRGMAFTRLKLFRFWGQQCRHAHRCHHIPSTWQCTLHVSNNLDCCVGEDCNLSLCLWPYISYTPSQYWYSITLNFTRFILFLLLWYSSWRPGWELCWVGEELQEEIPQTQVNPWWPKCRRTNNTVKVCVEKKRRGVES